jgi:glycosyltransferase involved in cell wall biosynthesis
MTALHRIAFIGNSLPRRCGIATFTTDLQLAIAELPEAVETSIVAMNDADQAYSYPASVGFTVDEAGLEDYARAADFLNAGGFDLVSLQHEFGIFGGEAGGHIMALLGRLTMPIVTTLHTVLADPTPVQRKVLNDIMAVSARVVVMAKMGRDLLVGTYGVRADKIEIIPHGIPDFAFVEPDAAKTKLGFADRTVILTFGLLSPNKGIEVMIDAMPVILDSRPDAVYVVLGATHPNLVRIEGEAYRHRLVARAKALGIEDHVVFLDQFVDRPTLLDYIAMSDVYVTPYLNQAQMTSGTLAYSFGLGKAVVSTPYWHAKELLADEHGILVPFGDPQALGREIAALLTDEPRRNAMRRRAYENSRSMTWERTAERYLSAFQTARATGPLRPTAQIHRMAPPRDERPLPEIQFGHLHAMTDDTGLLQHAIYSVPDRLHGYCVDDNARGLLLAAMLNTPGEQHLPDHTAACFAAFVQHAWNPDVRRFRNFMSFDRRWLEEQGSEDSHGRTLWALGISARQDASPPRRRWATSLFAEALPVIEGFASPRAWVFALLGLDGYCAAVPVDAFAREVRRRLAGRLLRLLAAVETSDWVWFEEGLSYDNARFSEALIVTGTATGIPAYVDAGLRSLDWLMMRQTTATGLFRPVGTEGFGDIRTAPRAFDQQPVEAAATISACLAALRASGNPKWRGDARRAFAWFLGRNDLSEPLVDVDTGSCRDGLHPDRRNENRGAESVVSYLLGLTQLRQLERTSAARALPRPLPPAIRLPTNQSVQPPRGRLVANHVSQPAGTLPAP